MQYNNFHCHAGAVLYALRFWRTLKSSWRWIAGTDFSKPSNGKRTQVWLSCRESTESLFRVQSLFLFCVLTYGRLRVAARRNLNMKQWHVLRLDVHGFCSYVKYLRIYKIIKSIYKIKSTLFFCALFKDGFSTWEHVESLVGWLWKMYWEAYVRKWLWPNWSSYNV